MKAVILTQFGGPEVLQLKELGKPVALDNEVLVRVRATSVNFGDLLVRNLKDVTPRSFHMPGLFLLMAKIFLGFRKPKISILGSEFAGDVEAVGKDVKSFKPGDAVFGYLGQSMGAYAGYLRVPENGVLALKPANMTYDEAAVVSYGAIMALPLLKQANLQPGQKVLINGASGGIGSAAVQIAKHLGAEVTGVCATPRLAFVKSLGADRVIDYTREDFTTNGVRYDLIFDVLGHTSFERCKGSLTPNGVLFYASFKMKQVLQMLWTSRSAGQRVVCAMAPGSVQDLIAVRELIEAGQIKTVIDRRFPLEQAAQAHRYVEEGNKQGSVVITL